jgi:hypothetical protein
MLNCYIAQVAYDLPHVTNDMIMRFMDVPPEEVLGSIALPSSVGEKQRLQFGSISDMNNNGADAGRWIQADCKSFK